MNIVVKIIVLTVFACILQLLYLKQMHMFQLNAYKPAAHLKWIKRQIRTNVFLLYFRFVFPVKAKKPLVHTPRVKRMSVTFFIMMVFSFTADLHTFGFPVFVFTPVIFLLSPLIPIIVNYINYPIEFNVRRYFIHDAKKILTQHKPIIIGITGSFGKTSVKYFLTQLLKEKYSVLMTPESYNTPMGVVKTIRESLRPTHDIFICEMGAKNIGDIKELCEIVHPEIGVVTYVGEQHLETFKTIENIYRTKMELAAYANTMFVNMDSPMIAKNCPNQSFNTYGTVESARYRASDIRISSGGTTFDYLYDSAVIKDLSTQLIGRSNIINLTAAICVSLSLGLSEASLRRALSFIEPVPHRQELRVSGDITMIDDAFNSNPKGCESALETLSMFDCKKILITPGMVELGTMEDACNRVFGMQAAKVCDTVVLVGKNQTKSIYEGLLQGNFHPENIRIEESFLQAFAFVQGIGGKKAVLIENDLPDNY